MPASPLATRIAAVRRFNRFYTHLIGVLQEHLLQSPFSLAEARVLCELQAGEASPTDIGRRLGVDAGYLSRLMAGLEGRRLLARRASGGDGRRSVVRLTARGRQAVDGLDRRARAEVAALLRPLPAPRQTRLVTAMRQIERVLGADAGADAPCFLRPHGPGDMGWVVQRHGVLYAEEHGWDDRFEALVAAIVARFLRLYDPSGERCWIAEQGGENVGSIFLVRRSRTIGQLRLLLVEPVARGKGIGMQLVDECLRFAREVRYRKVVLWTTDVLHDARRLYERAGFRMVAEKPEHGFGPAVTGQFWEVRL